MYKLMLILSLSLLIVGCPGPQPHPDNDVDVVEEPDIEDYYNNYLNRRLLLMGTPRGEYAKVLSLSEELVDIYRKVAASGEKAVDNKKNAILRHGEPIEKVLEDTSLSHAEKATQIRELVKKNVR